LEIEGKVVLSGYIALYYCGQFKVTFEKKGWPTMPCRKQTRRLATFDPFLNKSRGMSGYLASRFSLNIKTPEMRAPIMIRHRTCGDFHGNVAPPNSNPRRTIKVTARIERLPNQSTAFRPSTTAVFGLCTSREDQQ
jgi:hypothetical protein